MLPIHIEMPLPVYDGFIDKCDPSSHEYAILKYGIVRPPQGDRSAERTLEINCDIGDADKLLFLASQVYPEAVHYIARASTPR